MKPLTLSVIIPLYNGALETLRALNTMQGAAYTSHEYIVQDDCGQYPADIRLCFHPAQAIIDVNAHNLGFAGNCNAGAARASGDVLFFVNQDVFAVMPQSQNWDAAILRQFAFDDSDKVGIVGARLLFPDGSIQSAGGEFDAIGTPYHRCIGYSNPNYHEVATPREIEWTTGAAFAIRRSVFEQIGGFDTGYRMYFEDVDACLRVKELGYKVLYEPACTFIHEVGSTGGSEFFSQSARRFKQKWVDTGKVSRNTFYAPVRYW